MPSINFDTGYKTYTINGDENNVIRVNLADPNLYNRMNEILSFFETFENEFKDDTTAFDAQKKIDEAIKDKIDYAFGKGTSKAVFGDVSCLTPANNEGECIFETFLKAIAPVIQSDMEEAAENQNRHISDLIDKGKADKYIQRIKSAAQ